MLLLGLAAAGAGRVCAQAPAQEEILEATVVYVAEESEIDVGGRLQLYQKLELAILGGERAGEILVVEHGTVPMATVQRYKTGDRVFVRATGELEGVGSTRAYYLDSPSRWIALAGVAALLALVVVLVSGWRGLTSLAGLALSFVVLFAYILPGLYAGKDPLRVTLIGAAMIVPVSFFLVHGVSLKTVVAVFGTALGLLLTLGLAWAAIEITRLTGYSSEDAMLLQALAPGAYDIRGLLVAGILVGVLGVLDDVTVSQAAIVQQLAEANPKLGWGQLYRRAMRVGQDHIASVVNTLALVYAGAALPLLLLLRSGAGPVRYLLSQEFLAEEIVRVAVASIGLMAAVPLTTLLAAAAISFRVRLYPITSDPASD